MKTQICLAPPSASQCPLIYILKLQEWKQPVCYSLCHTALLLVRYYYPHLRSTIEVLTSMLHYPHSIHALVVASPVSGGGHPTSALPSPLTYPADKSASIPWQICGLGRIFSSILWLPAGLYYRHGDWCDGGRGQFGASDAQQWARWQWPG